MSIAIVDYRNIGSETAVICLRLSEGVRPMKCLVMRYWRCSLSIESMGFISLVGERCDAMS